MFPLDFLTTHFEGYKNQGILAFFTPGREHGRCVAFFGLSNRQRHWLPDDDWPDTVSFSHPNDIFY